MTSEGFPRRNVTSLALDQELADSGLTVAWLLDTLWKHCPEFKDVLRDGIIEEVSHNFALFNTICMAFFNDNELFK